jgi:hypothetical protein
MEEEEEVRLRVAFVTDISCVLFCALPNVVYTHLSHRRENKTVSSYFLWSKLDIFRCEASSVNCPSVGRGGCDGREKLNLRKYIYCEKERKAISTQNKQTENTFSSESGRNLLDIFFYQ